MKKLHHPDLKTDLAEIDPVDLFYEKETYPADYGSVRDDKKRFRQFALILRRYWLMILVTNILLTGIVIVYVARRPIYYRTQSRVQVNADVTANVGAKTGGSVFVNSGSDPIYFTTQFQILESKNLLQRVVKTLDLENNQDFINPDKGQKLSTWQSVRRLFGLYTPPVPPRQKPVESKPLSAERETLVESDADAEKLAPLVDKVRGGLTISPVKDNRTANRETRLIEIEFTHRDPQIAAKIANAIADTYVLMNLEQKVESNKAAGDFLQKRVSELQSTILRDEEKLVNYSRDNQILAPDGNQNTVIQKLTDLNIKLGQAENERISAEVAYRNALQSPDTGLIAENKDAKTSQIESNLLTLNQRLKQLKTEYTDEWVEVVEVRRQIESLEKELANSRRQANTIQLATLKQNYQETLSREKELRDNFESQRSRVLVQNEAAITYRMIQQEIETNKKLLDNLLQKSKENDVVLNGTPNNVLVADRALIPRSPVDLRATKDILIACLGSLGLGIGLAFLRNWINNTVYYTDDTEKKFNLPLLTTVPFEKRQLTNKLLSIGSAAKNSSNLLSVDKPEIVEAFTKLRTYLILSKENNQIILITSADSNEGKTTIAANLAKIFAEAQDKILLIDADLRRPRLHSIFNIPNDLGMTALLVDRKLDFKDVIQKVEQSNLYLLPAGQPVSNPTNLLSSNRMNNLLKKFAEEYSFIIIDSPPVLLFSDSLVLATLCDSVVFVIRNGYSTYQTVRQALQTLYKIGANISGFALNGVSGKAAFAKLHRYYYAKDSLAGTETLDS